MSSTNYDPTDYQLFVQTGAGIPYLIGMTGTGVPTTQVSGTGAILTVAMSTDLTAYAKLDGTNQPFTGNLQLSGSSIFVNEGSGVFGTVSSDKYLSKTHEVPFYSPRQQTQFTPLAAATVQGIGAPLATIAATLSQPAWSNAFGWSQNIATSTVVNNNAGFIGVAQFAVISGTQSATNQPVNNGIDFRTRFCTPDASYAGASGCRILIGLTSQATPATAVGSDNPAGNYMALQFCTASGSSRQDTTFQIFTKNNTTQATGSMTLAPIQNCIYDLYLNYPNVSLGGTGTVTWRLDNITSGTSATGATTSFVPLANTAMLPMMHILTSSSGTSTARNLKWTSMHISSMV